MALTGGFVHGHITRWQQQLTSPYYPHRKHWPTRVYHHAPLENALAILREGVLRSRNDEQNTHPRDVAAPGVISAATTAHDLVRLYFRPKTPTQYSIEGIRKTGECPYGDQTHAPMLIMFGLNSRVILCQPDVQFSTKNMQIGSAQIGNDAAFFNAIPFEKVYHEGGTGGDRSITDARCAEVLTNSPLRLDDCLEEIYFRSEPERDTVLHALGNLRDRWADKCIVSDALKLFEKKYAFVREVSLTPKGLIFVFNERHDRKTLRVEAEVFRENGTSVLSFEKDDLPASPPGARRWIVKASFLPGVYLVRIKLEGHLAFEAQIPLIDVVI